jgi:hypothetical protein
VLLQKENGCLNTRVVYSDAASSLVHKTENLGTAAPKEKRL